MNVFALNIILALLWSTLTGKFTIVNLCFGFVLSSFSLWIIRDRLPTGKYFLRVYLLLNLARLFLYELVLSSIRVVRIVLSPKCEFKAGFIAFQLTVESNFEILLLANLITLTPGTLSVDISDDRSTLYIHAIDASNVNELRRDIAEGFEKKIMEALR